MPEQDKLKTIEEYGTPTGVPSGGHCPVCTLSFKGRAAGWCERDWRWEHKSHLSSVMHGLISETKAREEKYEVREK